ncbi:unnamed protein product [Somion occarium]|uniref:AB hydrolase-1 domain-containing protein n=1 Tax=Somion occarium TaxID=3059160 RepID=A0ABP1DCY4_9APHY
MSSIVFSDSAVFETSRTINGRSLKMVAKRYTTNHSQNDDMCVFSLGETDKEHWEPTLDCLFAPHADQKLIRGIREIWSFDWFAHGDSAVANQELLHSNEFIPSTAEWGAAIADFARSRLASHHLVAIGHSAGASAVLHFANSLGDARQSFLRSIVLVEPIFFNRDEFAMFGEAPTDLMIKGIAAQRFQWDNKRSAFNWFKSRVPWKTWDERVLAVYVNHGLRPLVADDLFGPVVTKLSKKYESLCFGDVECECHFQAPELVTALCREVPIHVIQGVNNRDLVPEPSSKCVTDESRGRFVASHTWVPRAGHMIVQQQPEGLARALVRVLKGEASGTVTLQEDTRSKL